MPQTRKVKFDKAAWAWSESADPENITEENIKCAYRLNLTKCKVGCKRNCRGNPFCLSGLGEARWLEGTLEESDDEDQDLDIKKPNLFVGLKNLGATCYVNSLLQLWFHNLAFRRAIFCWNPLEDRVESLTVQCDEEIMNPPRTVVGHLQLIFGLLQFGKKRAADPSEFIKVLDLEPSIQQDAQEFSKLFISLLEDSLREQSNPSVRDLINDNFKGEYSYITRCSKCQKESVSPSMFYELELNVKGNKTLHESISEFLKEEKLEGLNKYSCGLCQEKQEASRFIRLQSLPRVLNLQLMRFIYDRQKGHKKKINSSIQFPDTLDMSAYLANGGGEKMPTMYNLTAVLIHNGPSAYSGHYFAHICDQMTGTWYKFNDENVEKMEGKKLKLGCEDDLEVSDGKPKTKHTRLGKSMLSSSNAYMLVYTASMTEETKQPIEESILSQYLLRQITKFNTDFDEFIEKAKEEKRNRKINGKVQKAEMASILMSLPAENSDEWEAVSTKWLSYWLTNTKSIVDPVDNSKLLCSHNKLDPDSLNHTKYINMNVAETIFEKYSGGPRLPSTLAQCKECIIAKCRGIRKKAQIMEDAKEITNLLKLKENLEGPCFWVGKSSLKSWRKKALALLNEREEDLTRPVSLITSKYDLPSPKTEQNSDSCNGEEHSVTLASPEGIESLIFTYEKFNDVDSRARRKNVGDTIVLLDNIIAEASGIKSKWLFFLKTSDSSFDLTNDVLENMTNLQQTWSDLALRIDDFYDTIKNISESSLENSKDVNLMPSTMKLDKIMNGEYSNNYFEENSKKRKFEDEDEKEDSDEGKNNGSGNKSDDEDEDEEDFNADIVCSHGNMVHEESARRLIPENIWKMLRKYFSDAREFPKEIEPCHDCQCLASEGQVAQDLYKQQAQSQKEVLLDLFMGKNRPKPQTGLYHIICVPEFLEPWRRFLREAGKREPLYSLRNTTLICVHGLLVYNPDLEDEGSKIALVTQFEWNILSSLYVVDQDITAEWDSSNVLTTVPAICGECLTERLEREQRALLDYSKAKLYIRPVSNCKTSPDEKIDNPPSPTGENKVPKRPRCDPEVVRRSTRHRKVRGEKELTMSSSQTLKDLRLQILYSFGVLPYDQQLTTEDGRELVENAATLSSLHIYPNSVILLKVDEPTKGFEFTSTAVEDFIRTSEPEAGFKGTGLMKRHD